MFKKLLSNAAHELFYIVTKRYTEIGAIPAFNKKRILCSVFIFATLIQVIIEAGLFIKDV